MSYLTRIAQLKTIDLPLKEIMQTFAILFQYSLSY